jgi:hypothetical protein
MSKIEVDQIDPQSSTNLIIGTSGDTIKTGTGTSLVIQGDGSSANGIVTLNCSQNSHGVKLSSPDHSGGQSYTMKLPATNITAGKFLKVDSITGSGATAVGQLSFADEPGGGKILQVVSATDSANYSVTSTSFVNSSNGLTLNITPSATTSKIFVQVSVSNLYGASGNNIFLTIYRGSTNLGGSNGMATHGGFNENVPASMTILDSPSSTSQLTYQVYAKVTGGTHDYGSTNSVSTITAFEVGA